MFFFIIIICDYNFIFYRICSDNFRGKNTTYFQFLSSPVRLLWRKFLCVQCNVCNTYLNIQIFVRINWFRHVLVHARVIAHLSRQILRYHQFTYVYQKLWSDDVWFLRHGVWQMDGWTDGRMDRWTDGQMDGWTDGWMNGWIEKVT